MLIALGSVGLILILWIIATTNRFVRLKNYIKESWAGIDVELRRRHDLIPNLVQTVKAYAAHESATLDRLVQARAKAMEEPGPIDRKIERERELVSSANQLLAVAEGYPALKASEQFMNLQKELSLTEDRIAAARRFYNANVRDYNSLLSSFPAGSLGRSQGHVEAPYYQVDELNVRAAPQVAEMGI